MLTVRKDENSIQTNVTIYGLADLLVISEYQGLVHSRQRVRHHTAGRVLLFLETTDVLLR
jgi:hypothetical protein